MAYSHARLRKTLALVRIATGIVFVLTGSFKVSSLEFGKEIFPAFLESGLRGAAAAWVRPMLEAILSFGSARVGIGLGFVELFIGIALVLGLAVRPAAVIGMIYSAALLLVTWNPGETAASMMQTSEHQFRNLFPFLVLLLLGIGHAGETWGVGAFYHRHRALKWDREGKPEPQPVATEQKEYEPASFEEFAEMEARRVREQELQELSEFEDHETSNL